MESEEMRQDDGNRLGLVLTSLFWILLLFFIIIFYILTTSFIISYVPSLLTVSLRLFPFRYSFRSLISSPTHLSPFG